MTRLGPVLRTVLAKLYHGREDPDFNFHWYLSVIPRLTRVAGFELGSGMFSNPALAEAASDFLGKVQVETMVEQWQDRN